MIGEFTEKCSVYENLAKANGVEITKEIKDFVTDIVAYEDQTEEKRTLIDGQLKYLKSQTELQKHFDDNLYGSFYFNFYELLLNVTSPKILTRVLYLCTYMNYDNKLILDGKKNNHIPMTNKDIMDTLRLSEKEYYRTKKELINNNILILKDNTYYINNTYCKRGVIMKNKKESKIRTFDKAIRELYEKSTPKEHKFLALIYEMLPFINYDYNIVCKNPNEKNKYEIKPYTIKELCNIFGYKNQTIFKNKLLNLTINNEPVLIIVLIKNKSMIMINPKVYYKGNNAENVNDIEFMISINNRKTKEI